MPSEAFVSFASIDRLVLLPAVTFEVPVDVVKLLASKRADANSGNSKFSGASSEELLPPPPALKAPKSSPVSEEERSTKETFSASSRVSPASLI